MVMANETSDGWFSTEKFYKPTRLQWAKDELTKLKIQVPNTEDLAQKMEWTASSLGFQSLVNPTGTGFGKTAKGSGFTGNGLDEAQRQTLLDMACERGQRAEYKVVPLI